MNLNKNNFCESKLYKFLQYLSVDKNQFIRLIKFIFLEKNIFVILKIVI